MKLYYAPGACSLSPHIVLREAGIDAEYERVDVRTKVTETGRDFLSISPKGALPTLELDDGQILTEGPVIVQYLADQRPEMNLAPSAGDMARYRLQEWLNFISSEVHKTMAPMFSPAATSETHQKQRALLIAKLAFLDRTLGEKSFLMGDTSTVADAYLFTILTWTIPVQIDLAAWPAVKAYHSGIALRPPVRAALKAEGLIP